MHVADAERLLAHGGAVVHEVFAQLGYAREVHDAAPAAVLETHLGGGNYVLCFSLGVTFFNVQ